jgi:hypothetical protein
MHNISLRCSNDHPDGSTAQPLTELYYGVDVLSVQTLANSSGFERRFQQLSEIGGEWKLTDEAKGASPVITRRIASEVLPKIKLWQKNNAV